MAHDATKVLMGSTQSSDKPGSDVYASDPATYLAGLAVRVTSGGVLSVTKSAGRWAGVSLGKSLSDHKKTCVLRAGSRIPVLLERQPARGVIEITNYANLLTVTPDTITVGVTAFTAQSGAASPTTAVFQAATDNATTAASLVTQLNAHVATAALVVASIDPDDSEKVIITAKLNTTAGDTIALAYADLGSSTVGATVSGATLTDSDATSDWVVVGDKVYFSDTTGKADDPHSGATISDAVYVSAPMTGIAEDGSSVYVALVDMIGGL